MDRSSRSCWLRDNSSDRNGREKCVSAAQNDKRLDFNVKSLSTETSLGSALCHKITQMVVSKPFLDKHRSVIANEPEKRVSVPSPSQLSIREARKVCKNDCPTGGKLRFVRPGHLAD